MKILRVIAASILCSTGAVSADETLTPAHRSLVAAERAFVRLAAERGFRDSFHAYFAEDGIAFNPHPFRMKAYLANKPSVPGPWGVVWAPVYGDISAAGDLGWNTGPVVFEGRDGQADRHGMFFSVWKRQSNGDWKVILDIGADAPSAVVPLDTPFQTSPPSARSLPSGAAGRSAVEELLAVEREFLATAAAESLGRAYGARLAADARVHRPMTMPIVGAASLEAWANAQDGKLTGETLAADAASSGDLGYAYGRYEIAGPTPTAGYYARVWKRDGGNDWRIVFDTIAPLPAGVRPLTAKLARAEDDYFAGRWAEAATAYQAHVDAYPEDPFGWHRLGTSQIQLGRYAQAIRSLERGIEIGGGIPADFYNLACAHALAGAPENALDFVERAIAAGMTQRAQYESDPDLASLRGLPRFKTLMAGLDSPTP